MNTVENPDLGTMLQNRRQECGLTLIAVAERTRIRRAYLQALEENRFCDLPGEAYVIGFLRIYAGVLGLKPSTLMDAYRTQVAESGISEETKGSEKQKVAVPNRQKKSWGIMPWLSVILLVVGAFTLFSLRNFFSLREPLPPRAPVAVIDTTPAPPPEPPAEATVPNQAGTPADTIAADNVAKDAGNDATVAPTMMGEPKAVEAKVGEAGTVEQKVVETPITPAPAESATTIVEKPLIFDFPGNGVVRLESFGANQVEFSGDNRAPQKYALTSSAVLSWKIRQNARISFADPAAVKVWVDQQPLKLAGRGEIFLQRKQALGAAE